MDNETATAIRLADDYELRRLSECALGRIFGMMQRPSQPGDVAEYDRCRAIVMACAEALGKGPGRDNRPNWTRDRMAVLMTGG